MKEMSEHKIKSYFKKLSVSQPTYQPIYKGYLFSSYSFVNSVRDTISDNTKQIIWR